MTDFIIVGRGLAASVLMHSFRRQGLSFLVVGNPALSTCSQVAAGIWNPVVFKRMTRSWLADVLIPCLTEFYQECEQVTGKRFVTHRPIIKPFVEEQEKRLWEKKSQLELNTFIDPELYNDIPASLQNCQITNGYGRVLQSGNLNTAEFLSATADYFKERLLTETFDHSQLMVLPDQVSYKGHTARGVVFCEGHLVKNNPFFNWIPLKPAKGEVLTIQAPALGLEQEIFNKNGFLMRTGEGIYKTGATYEWQDLSEDPTKEGLLELKEKMSEMTVAGYSVLKHEAGIRPSSVDRRPIIGPHPEHHNLYVFNGLGTKGVMLAPFFAKNFVHFFSQEAALNAEVNINRFYDLYARRNN